MLYKHSFKYHEKKSQNIITELWFSAHLFRFLNPGSQLIYLFDWSKVYSSFTFDWDMDLS